MHICSFDHRDLDAPSLGIVQGGDVTRVRSDADSLESALRNGADWASLSAAAGSGTYSLDDVRLRTPVARPTNLVGIGLNYAGHAAEGGHDVPDEPVFFAKSPSSITGPGTIVRYHPGVTNLHYEGEFAVVVGRELRRADPDAALESIFGYTAANDVTARDMQAEDIGAANPWYRSKSMDTFTPLGPHVTPAGEGVDPDGAAIETRVNGDVVQSSNTDDLIFDVGTALSYVSHHVTLQPGDVVLTGTPAGVGPLTPGDEVSVTVDGVGTLVNTVEEV